MYVHQEDGIAKEERLQALSPCLAKIKYAATTCAINYILNFAHFLQILVSSNDSRIRLYDLRDLNLSCKYKGYVNISSQISASFR